MHTYVSMNSPAWIHLHEFICMNSLHEFLCMDSSAWIHLHGFICLNSSAFICMNSLTAVRCRVLMVVKECSHNDSQGGMAMECSSPCSHICPSSFFGLSRSFDPSSRCTTNHHNAKLLLPCHYWYIAMVFHHRNSISLKFTHIKVFEWQTYVHSFILIRMQLTWNIQYS